MAELNSVYVNVTGAEIKSALICAVWNEKTCLITRYLAYFALTLWVQLIL